MELVSNRRQLFNGLSLSTNYYRYYALLHWNKHRRTLIDETSDKSVVLDSSIQSILFQHLSDYGLFDYIRKSEVNLNLQQVAEIYIKCWLLQSILIIKTIQYSKYNFISSTYKDFIGTARLRTISDIPIRYYSYLYDRFYSYHPKDGIEISYGGHNYFHNVWMQYDGNQNFTHRVEKLVPLCGFNSNLESVLGYSLPTIMSIDEEAKFLIYENPDFEPNFILGLSYIDQPLFTKVGLTLAVRDSDSDSDDDTYYSSRVSLE